MAQKNTIYARNTGSHIGVRPRSFVMRRSEWGGTNVPEEMAQSGA